MWLIGVVILEVLALVISYHHAYFYLLVFLGLLYVLWYRDGKEYTGERRWEAFRNLFIWRWLSPVRYVPTSTAKLEAASRRVFLMTHIQTLSPVWWFGVQGDSLNLCYLLPPVFFAVPILRDVLLWTGAVTWRPNQSRADAILELISANRSVVYAPDALSWEIDHHLFDFCRLHKIELIPVVVFGEQNRYYIWNPPWVFHIQTFTRKYLGYPVPFFYWLKRLVSLSIHIGPVLHCEIYHSSSQLQQTFQEKVEAIQTIQGV